MALHRKAGVTAVLSNNLSRDEMVALIKERTAGAPNPVATSELRLSDLMSATLTGDDGLVVEPAGPQQQWISFSEPTEWNWQVTATRQGLHTLTLEFFAILNIAGESHPRFIRTLHKTIDVEVTGLSLYLPIVAAAVGAAGAAAAGLFLWRRRGRLGPVAGSVAASAVATAPAGGAGRIFISHAAADRRQALRICADIEAAGVKCWIAPRDIPPGADYGRSLIAAISECLGVVLVFSDHASQSHFVCAEIERAFSRKKPIFPVRLRNMPPAGPLELFIAAAQWTDAWGAERDRQLAALVASLRVLASDAPLPEPVHGAAGA